MANRYWITTAGGNFPGTTANWSTTSGGGGGASVPGVSDNAIFDGNSGTGTITANANVTIGQIFFDAADSGSAADFLGTFTLNQAVKISVGAFVTMSAGMTYNTTGTGGTFEARNPTNGWYSGSHDLGNTNFSATSGSNLWTLYGNTICGGIWSCGLTTQSFNLTIGSFASTGGVTWTLGSSTITVTGLNFDLSSLNVLNAGTSTIVFNVNSSADLQFKGNGKTFNNVKFLRTGTGKLIISGSNTYKKITCTPGLTIQVTAGTTQTLTDFPEINGIYNGTKTTLQSTSGGTAWNLSKATGIVVCDWLSLQDSHAAGGASFYAGNSTNVSGNTGWVFGAPAEELPAVKGKGKKTLGRGGSAQWIDIARARADLASRTRRRFVMPLKVGSSISVDLSEAGSAASVQSAVATFIGSRSEAASAAAMESAAGTFSGTMAENAAAASVASVSAAFSGTMAEAASAVDAQVVSVLFVGSGAEAASATSDAGGVYSTSGSESSATSASDHLSATYSTAAGASDAASAASASTASATFLGSLSEAASAAAFQGGGISFTVDLEELASAAAAQGALSIIRVSAAEAALAAVSQGAAAEFLRITAEAAAAKDVLAATADFSALLEEDADAEDFPYVRQRFFGIDPSAWYLEADRDAPVGFGETPLRRAGRSRINLKASRPSP